MKQKSAIIIVGKLGSGKSILSNYLSQKYNYNVYEIGDVVRQELEENNINLLPLKYAIKKMKLCGKDYFVKKVLNNINDSSTNIIVGVRSLIELEYLKNFFQTTYIIGIDADYKIRRKRYNVSKKNKKKNSSFCKRDKIEETWGILDVLDRADIIIENNWLNLGDFIDNIEKNINLNDYENNSNK